MAFPDTITFSLISHTNVGKTTLARTLLRRDIGDAADREHVTDTAAAYPLIESKGCRLVLWDTPGFGSTPRLLQRLRGRSSPLRWFVTQLWDRFRDRPFWCSQQAVLNVQNEADVVLYLVNAGESPAAAGYVDMEMEILTWIGKPVVLLLNQVGPPRPAVEEDLEETEWRWHIRRHAIVREVLALDAFARCWVQEGELMNAIAPLLPEPKREAFATLRAAWQQANADTFRRSIAVLARQLAAAAADRVAVSREKLLQKFGIARGSLDDELRTAREDLAARMAERSLAALDELIVLHGLTGRSARSAITADSADFGLPARVSESVWTAVGAALSGAAGGLVVDLKAGGLTFGGGSVIGFFAGGAGAWLLAKGLNLTRGDDHSVRWTREHFLVQAELALVTYLAVAHHGRGRGDWQDADHPPHWGAAAREAVAGVRPALEALWKRAADPAVDATALVDETAAALSAATVSLLRGLYPRIALDWLEP